MRIYEYRKGMYHYQHLPAFARYILDHHLEEFIRDNIRLSKELNVPILRFFKNYNDEQLLNLLRKTNVEYLNYLAQNRAKEQLENGLTRWLNDQLEVIGKFEITAEDVTAINYIRGKLFKKWIRTYPISTDDKFELLDEIDNFIFGATTSATDLYIDILKKKIEKETHFNQQLINASPGVIFILDIHKRRDIYINGNVKEMIGFSPEEILTFDDKLLPLLAHPNDMALIDNKLREIIDDSEGNTHQLEYRFRHKDGKYRWLRTYGVVFKRDENGKAKELLGITFEVTVEKEMSFDLQRREAQLLEAQSIAQIGSYEWDIVNDTSLHTPQIERILEFKGQQRHTDFLSHVHPDDREKVQRAIAESFITGYYDCQYRYIANGREKSLWARGIVTFDNQRKPVLMRGTIQDITELKRIEEELMRKTYELERSNESLQQFASIASHDLKEPLRKMSMYSDMVLTLEGEKLSQSSHTTLGKVKASSIRMQSMIEDILNFSSLTAEGKKQRVNLQQVVKDALDILQESIQEKNATVTFDDLPEANVIPSQMRQLFQNLFANSLKFARKDVAPEITISHRYVKSDDAAHTRGVSATRFLEILVTDNGIGFRQEFADRIFGLFTRLHSREHYEGSGLGLSICKRIVENHGGSIHALSRPQNGATFVIRIPD